MTCKHCADYMRKALEDVPGFDEACAVLQMDPRDPAQHERIFEIFSSVGQFGTIRLARLYPDLTDEAQFRTVARAAQRFYWMLLDWWTDRRIEEALGRG